MKPNPLPSAEVLRALLDYNPETGALTWRLRPASMFRDKRTSAEFKAIAWNEQWAGQPALCSMCEDGYLKGMVCGQYVLAHRVIWKMVHGVDADEIDHIDQDRAHNRIVNLRDVSSSLNQRNRRRPSTNKSGHIGVCWAKQRGKWLSYIRGANGKILHLGYFSEIEDAVAARAARNEALHYHPNHGASA